MPAREVNLSALLNSVEAAGPTEGVDALAAQLADMVGATEVSFLIADIAGGTLVRLARSASGNGSPVGSYQPPDAVPVAGTAAGTAMRTQTIQIEPSSDGDKVCVHAPVTERGEAVGVLELLLPCPPDAETVANVADAAHALAFVVIADRRYTDLYEWCSRHASLTLEAEINRRLLPMSYTCEGATFSLAGWLAPATEAGGDAFDFAVDRDVLHLSVTDAMGHGVAASLLATLGVGSLRNSRREGLPLVEHARAANRALHEHARSDQLMTGQMFRVDLTNGRVDVVNAGHVLPHLVRGGKTTEVVLEADAPFGVDARATYRSQAFTLLPGDRLVLLTDGMLERKAAAADVRGLLSEIGHLHPREAVQALTAAVVAASDDELEDDATTLVLDWYGGPDQAREARSGASVARASS